MAHSLTTIPNSADAGTNPMVWTLVEPGVAIVASSLVTIRPLLRQLRLKGFESTEHSSRSRGFWGRYGRGGGGASKLEENKPRSKRRSRAASSGMDAFERNEIGLDDLEAGHGASDARRTSVRHSKISTGSRETMRDEGVGRKSVVRNFSTPLSFVAVREDEKEVAVNDDDDDDPPLSPWLRSSARAESQGGAVVHQEHGQSPKTLRGHLQNGKPVWRSERPNSPGETEFIQGLPNAALRPGLAE